MKEFTASHPMYKTVQVVAAIMEIEAKAEHVSKNVGGNLAEKFYDENFADKLSVYDLAVAAGVLLTMVQENQEIYKLCDTISMVALIQADGDKDKALVSIKEIVTKLVHS